MITQTGLNGSFFKDQSHPNLIESSNIEFISDRCQMENGL